MKVEITDILKAQNLLQKIIKKTELDHSISASDKIGAPIYFKFENTQRTGSFKIRGAYNKIMNLTPAEKQKGVIACSAGNHAQGVALSASLAGVQSTVIMPESAPLNKVAATRGYGANVILKGEIFDDAYTVARQIEIDTGATFVHPYEDELVIAGQGTIGTEILEQLPDVDTVVVPIGGGGLISGVAIAVKSKNPKCRVIGVQSDQAQGMSQLFHRHPLAPLKKRISTIADGIAIKNPSLKMYENFISRYVDEVVTVNENEIAEGIVFLIERLKTVTEGSGASGWAAVMNGKIKLGKKNVVLLSGGNIDLNIVAKVIERGQIKRGRIGQLSVVVDDLPGNLNRLTQTIAKEKANVLEVHHDRLAEGLLLRETRINFILETNSLEHLERVKRKVLNHDSD